MAGPIRELQTLQKIADAVAFAFQNHLIDLLTHDYDVACYFVQAVRGPSSTLTDTLFVQRPDFYWLWECKVFAVGFMR
ncbi:hypothetical protein TNIN_465551 [Trichonephila inaurata madagascariensis]|uniref:Uncharacterized protein n=1 Tax=Trichonephila inaurata madagascariensis TaxID=2747483 RepID=A0A8X6XR51_9ARAC|nr:hypothetical protein TNIN_465551 [Trichonephila inaurata madagascariensis]